MCTLIVALKAFSDVDLLVAANRDERLDRPASPPKIHEPTDNRPLAVLAPVDDKAGGTWLGLNSAGMFCGITNRFGCVPPDPTRSSRGDLVFRALGYEKPDAAARTLAQTDPLSTNRFHLIMADGNRAWAVVHDDRRVWAEELGPGLHILTERSYGAASSGRADWIGSQLADHLGGPAPDSQAFSRLLSHHHPDDPFEGTCVHFPALNYGTRSQTQLRLGCSSGRDSMWHTEGPPCKTQAVEQSDLLVALSARTD